MIPIIDIDSLSDAGHAGSNALTSIGRACERFGFFQVVNHGIPSPLIDRMWEQTRRFFDQPRSVKLSIARTKKNPRGYYDRELTKNVRDLKEVFDFGYRPFPDHPDDHPRNRAAIDGFNQWPPDLPDFRRTMLEYYAGCERLASRLVDACCANLGVNVGTLRDAFEPSHTSFIRLNYYPLGDPLAPDEAKRVTRLGDMALHHHTDAGALTLLLQDAVGGLQVDVDGAWLNVTPVAGALVVNLGDMMQIWSNDRYRAALHRVLPRSGVERYSVPFFYNPTYETDCAPLVGATGGRPAYRTVNWGRFRQSRTDGDYADYGDEIQIEDFRITP